MKLSTRLGSNARSGDVALVEVRVRVALSTVYAASASVLGGCDGGGQEEEIEEGENDSEDGLHFVFIASGYKVGWIDF